MRKEFLVVGLLLCFACGVSAWGNEGHEVVAAIAASRLTPAAQKIVNADLQGRTMASLASVADDYRSLNQGKWTSPLHYTNMPRSATSWKESHCPNPPSCVVKAIQNYTSILGAQPTLRCNLSPVVEPCALVFLIHFVGDVHQPLHAGYADDSDGNTVQVSFFGKATNLHSVWDSGIIGRYQPSSSALVADLLNVIDKNPAIVQRYMAEMDPGKWADESFQIVRADVYHFVDLETSSNSSAVEAAPIVLGEKYYQNNLPTVKDRIMGAGIRLAALLNKLLA